MFQSCVQCTRLFQIKYLFVRDANLNGTCVRFIYLFYTICMAKFKISQYYLSIATELGPVGFKRLQREAIIKSLFFYK